MKIFRKLKERLWLMRDAFKTQVLGKMASTSATSIWNRYPRTAHWLYNHLWVVILVSIGVDWLPSAKGNWPLAVLLAFFIEGTWLAMLLGITHRGFLCEHCIGQFPLDGELLAQRKRPALKSRHFRGKWYAGCWIAGLLLTFTHGLMHFNGWHYLLTLSLVSLPLVWWFGRVVIVHDKLEVWCPWCRDDGGGRARSTTPDPSEMIPA